ncbi:hypothetical protein C8Q80DRAFT_788258 [Daedaleopsis nitida]|nr:hypothetical protein C8Q80DRAFT_788258 [Daedaleopsis nitida]
MSPSVASIHTVGSAGRPSDRGLSIGQAPAIHHVLLASWRTIPDLATHPNPPYDILGHPSSHSQDHTTARRSAAQCPHRPHPRSQSTFMGIQVHARSLSRPFPARLASLPLSYFLVQPETTSGDRPTRFRLREGAFLDRPGHVHSLAPALRAKQQSIHLLSVRTPGATRTAIAICIPSASNLALSTPSLDTRATKGERSHKEATLAG